MQENRRLIAYIFVGAWVVAPFLALLYDLTLGLGVLAAGLAATAFLALDAAKSAAAELQHRLRILALVNGALAIVAVGVILVRLLG